MVVPTVLKQPAARSPLTVLLGDPSLPDPTKRTGRFEAEDLDCIARMEAALAELGRYEVRVLHRHETLLHDLTQDQHRLVFNLCDTGFRNVPTLECHVASLLELLDIPYTGAQPAAMVTCYDKSMVRGVAAALGVPVPGERYFQTAEAAAAEQLELPALIKPNHGDGSVGITQLSLVRTPTEARRYLDWLGRTLPGRSVLVQEYLPGPEYAVGLVGNPDSGLRALPVLEVDFSRLPAGSPPILCFESKTDPESPYWSDIGFAAARLPEALREHMIADCRRLFSRLGLRDYARFDFRTDAAGEVKLMEVNPNPAWGYDGKLALMGVQAGMAYSAVLGAILEAAEVRIASGTAGAAGRGSGAAD